MEEARLEENLEFSIHNIKLNKSMISKLKIQIKEEKIFEALIIVTIKSRQPFWPCMDSLSS